MPGVDPNSGNPYQGVYDPTGGMASMMLSLAGGMYAQSAGAIPFQFAPSQSAYDYLQNYQRSQEAWNAMKGVQGMEAARAQRLYMGAANLFGYGNNPTVQAWGNQIGQNYGYIAPMLAQAPLGRAIMDAAAGGHGSSMLAAHDIMGYRNMIDPVTGGFGYSAATGVALTHGIENRLFSDGGRNMRGLSITDMTGFYGEMARSGTMMPRSARDAGGNVRAEEVKRVSETMGEMTDVLRALKDIVGPNGSKEQLAQALKDFTQNNAGGQSWKEIAQSLRLTEQLAKQSGIGVEQMRMVTGYLGQTAAAEGISRASVMPAAQSMAAYQAGWMTSGLSQIPGLDMQRESLMHGQLTQRAGASPAAGQLGATLRIGGEMGFTAGSEGERLFKAIQAGQTTYDNGKSVYLSEQEWIGVMSRSGVDAGMANQMRRQTAPNQRAVFNSPAVDVSRQLQGQLDIQPRLGAGIASTLGGTGLGRGMNSRKLQSLGSTLAAALMNLPPEAIAKATKGDLSDVVPAIKKALEGAGVSISDAEARKYASVIYGAAGNSAAQRGYESFERAYAAHSPAALREAERMRTMGGLRADVASELSGIGEDPFIKRVADAVASATPDTKPEEFLQKILNVVPTQELKDQLQGHVSEVQKAISEGEAALKAPGMIDPKTGRLTKAGTEERKKHLERVRELMKPVASDYEAIREARKASGEDPKIPAPAASAPEGGEDAPAASGGGSDPGRLTGGGALTLSGTITIPGLGRGTLTGSAHRSGVGTA